MSAAHKVVPGDTLSKIAAKNGVTLQQLLAANPQYKTNPNLIRVGDAIKMPQPKLSQKQPAGTACVLCAHQNKIDDSLTSKTPQELRKAAAEAVFPGHQSYQNCGLQSSRQLIEQAKGKSLSMSEREFLDDAIAHGEARKVEPYPEESGGSGLSTLKDLLLRHGVPSDVKWSFTDSGLKGDLTDAIKEKKGVIVAADPGVLWSHSDNPEIRKVAAQYEGGGHAVVVTDGEFDTDGNMTHVWINDTGTGMRQKMKTEDLMSSIQARTGPSQILVTEQPIWP